MFIICVLKKTSHRKFNKYLQHKNDVINNIQLCHSDNIIKMSITIYMQYGAQQQKNIGENDYI